MNTEKNNNKSNELSTKPENLKRPTSAERLGDFLTQKEQTTQASLNISAATFKPKEHNDHYGCGCPKAPNGSSYGFAGK